jgi:endonuclease YncB( thermonuclease family)
LVPRPNSSIGSTPTAPATKSQCCGRLLGQMEFRNWTSLKLFGIAAVLGATALGISNEIQWLQARAKEATISGPARVIDGDTVVVAGVHVRLKGVDAAELPTPLGEIARTTMRAIVGNSELSCQLTGERSWRREVGFCFTSDGVDINRRIVELGVALSCPRYSTRYLEFEQPVALAVQSRAPYCLQH